MNLVQEKLDVSTKKRANLFNWRGQFTPEFVEYILDSSVLKKDSLIADPFAGSGTVLIESSTKGYASVGFEINPAAYQMAKFYQYSELDLSERYEFLFLLESQLSEIIPDSNGELIYTNSKDYRTAYRGLINASKRIQDIANEQNTSFLINMLFASEKDIKLTVKASIHRSFAYFKKILLNLPYICAEMKIHNSDARRIAEFYTETVDLIITSPPYINVFNYHQNYRAISESFQYKTLDVAKSEFGSNRKHRGNRLLTVVQYCIDMETAINSFWESLSHTGKMVMVVGRESNVRKTPFYNGKILLEIIYHMNGFKNITSQERSFTNKFGKKIVEDILIISKNPGTSPEIGKARSIAEKHILKAKAIAPEDVLADFEEALSKIDIVLPSPIFDL